MTTSAVKPIIDISSDCPASVAAAFTTLDLSGRVVCGRLFTSECYDHEVGAQAWMVLDSVFNVVAVMRGGSAKIIARRTRNS